MTGQLAAILAAQRATADLHGDADRITWYEAQEHTTPLQH